MTPPDKTTAPPWYGDGNAALRASNTELAHWLAVTSDENRDWWFARRQEDSATASLCYAASHEGQIEHMHRELAQARERIAWLERHYQPQDDTHTGEADQS